MGPLLHGEAVILGMGAELQLSAMFANLPRDDEQRAHALLRQFPSPPVLAADIAVGLAALAQDKKGSRVALLERLGRAVVSAEVPAWALEQMVRRLCAQLAGAQG
jgi:3-dehydroquinate synthetase